MKDKWKKFFRPIGFMDMLEERSDTSIIKELTEMLYDKQDTSKKIQKKDALLQHLIKKIEKGNFEFKDGNTILYLFSALR